MAHQETLINWLNDAYGMERNLIQVLEHRVKDASGHPDMQARVQQHLQETRQHATLIKDCIERLGGSTSSIKAGIADVMGSFQGRSTEPAKDEIVKNILADYASEQFEIASYKSLIAAAESLGDSQTTSVCRQILHEEETMAHWLDQHIASVTQEYLSMRAREHGA